MPKIYTDEKRQEITEQLLEASLNIIRRFGVKKLSIEEITKKAGIAQGTFYNFFASKEMLIFALAERYQAHIDGRMRAVVEEKGYIGRDDLRQLYTNMLLKDDDNILRFMSRDDVQTLMTRLPRTCAPRFADVRAQIEQNLAFIRVKAENVDISAVINWVQMMHLAVQNKDLLIEEGLDKVVGVLIENMLDEIFGSDQNGI